MQQYVVNVPNGLNLAGSIEFAIQLRSLPPADEYLFDFGKVGWVSPFSLLYISSEVQRCVDKYPSAKFSVSNHRHMGYAAHMGFFRAFRVDFGKSPGEAPGSQTHFPITLFECDQLRREAAESHVAVAETIESRSQDISSILCQNDSGSLFDALAYSLREIMRNVVEHSESSQFGLCAQYWPKKGTVELGLVDRGIGIGAALRENPKLQFDSGGDALRLALMPGISGKAHKQRNEARYNVWANSGFGLYMTSRLCRNGGNFFIASGDCGLLLKAKDKTDVQIPFEGTALRLSLCVDSIQDISSKLKQFREEGYEVAARFGKSAVLSASTASQMLARDFLDR
ncbi:MAG: hypothetical protein Q7U76_03900 [Nitrospirota bacterium]|nr:hypothetical protein [Nitrospirota bacterium]